MRKITFILLLALSAIAGQVNAQVTPTTITDGQFAPGTVFYRIKYTNPSPNRYITINSDVTTTTTAADATLFAFVGNSTDGYRIYAKGDATNYIYLTTTTSTTGDDNVEYGTSETYDKFKIRTNGSGYTILQYGPYNSTTPSSLNYISGASLKTWSSLDSPTDNNCRVVFEATEISLLYTYSFNGETVNKVAYGTIGSTYPDPAPAFCTTTDPKPSGNVAEGGTNTATFNVTWNGPFQFSSTIDEAKWYLMTGGRFSGTGTLPVMRYTEGQNYIKLLDNDKNFSYGKNEQWAFVGNPFDGFKIYNRANNGRLICTTTMGSNEGRDTNPYVSTGELPSGFTELWDIHTQKVGTAADQITIPGGFSISEHGTTYKLNRRGYGSAASTDSRLAFWTGGADNGSTFTASQANLPDLTLNLFEGDGKTYASFYIDYPVVVTSDNVQVYTGTVKGNTLNMTKAEGKIIPAGVGVVLIGDDRDATTAALSIANSEGTLAPGSIEGTTVNLPITGDQGSYLVLGPSTDEVPTLGFYQPTATTIPAYKAYIHLASSPVRGFNFNFDGTTTAIDNATLSTEKAQGIYDLSGRRVSKAGKGIYIMGGKKIYVK